MSGRAVLRRPPRSAPTAPWRSALAVLALWVAGLCAAAQFAKIGLVLPELDRAYPDAGAGLGFLVSSVSAVGAILGLVAGALAARIGPRRLLLGGLVLGAALSFAQAALPPLPVLLGSRLLEGAAHLAVVVTAPTLVATTSGDRWRPAAMTLWGTFFGVAFALTGWLGLPLVEARGLPALFLAHGACCALAAAGVALALPRRDVPAPVAAPGEGTSRKGAARGTARARPPGVLAQHLRAWTSPHIAAPAAGWLFYTLTFVALLAVLPATVAPQARAFTATALPLASIVASMTLGVALLARLPAVRVISIGFVAAAAIAALLVPLSGEPLVAVTLFAALGLVQGASFAAVPELNPDPADQALANGALAQAGNVGNGLGTPLALALLGAGGLDALVALAIGCYVAGTVAHARLARARTRSATTPPEARG